VHLQNDVHGSRNGHHDSLHRKADTLPHRLPELPRGISPACPTQNADIISILTVPLQLDVQGLQILVTSADRGGSSTAKAKSKRSEGLEILSNAKLLLKEGQRYALVGRNGTGKSSTFLPASTFALNGFP
jgi:ABC-type multidrug transport system fused ATPase/permease subunit